MMVFHPSDYFPCLYSDNFCFCPCSDCHQNFYWNFYHICCLFYLCSGYPCQMMVFHPSDYFPYLYFDNFCFYLCYPYFEIYFCYSLYYYLYLQFQSFYLPYSGDFCYFFDYYYLIQHSIPLYPHFLFYLFRLCFVLLSYPVYLYLEFLLHIYYDFR